MTSDKKDPNNPNKPHKDIHYLGKDEAEMPSVDHQKMFDKAKLMWKIYLERVAVMPPQDFPLTFKPWIWNMFVGSITLMMVNLVRKSSMKEKMMTILP